MVRQQPFDFLFVSPSAAKLFLTCCEKNRLFFATGEKKVCPEKNSIAPQKIKWLLPYCDLDWTSQAIPVTLLTSS